MRKVAYALIRIRRLRLLNLKMKRNAHFVVRPQSKLVYSKRHLFAGMFSKNYIVGSWKGKRWLNPYKGRVASILHSPFYNLDSGSYEWSDPRVLEMEAVLPYYTIFFEHLAKELTQLKFHNVKLKPTELSEGASIGYEISKMFDSPLFRKLFTNNAPAVMKPFLLSPIESYYLGKMRSPMRVAKFNIRMREEQRKYAKFMLLSQRQLCNVVRKAYTFYGRSFYNFAIILEHRIDNVICRLNYTNNNYLACFWIKNGGVMIQSSNFTNNIFFRGLPRHAYLKSYIGQYDLLHIRNNAVVGLSGLMNVFNFKFNIFYLLILLGFVNDLASARMLVEAGCVSLNGKQYTLTNKPMHLNLVNNIVVRKYSNYLIETWYIQHYQSILLQLRNFFLQKGVKGRNRIAVKNGRVYYLKQLYLSLNVLLLSLGAPNLYAVKRYFAANSNLKLYPKNSNLDVYDSLVEGSQYQKGLSVLLDNGGFFEINNFKAAARPLKGSDTSLVLGVLYNGSKRLLNAKLNAAKLLATS